MDDKTRAMIALGGGGVVIIILWLLSHRAPITMTSPAQIVVSPDNQAAPVIDNNFDFGDINLGSIYLNTPPAVSSGCECGCSQPSTDYLNAIQASANAYSQGLNELQTEVANAYMATLPPYIQQYIDNPLNPQAQAAASLFANPYA